MPLKKNREKGQTIVETGLCMMFLIPLFAGMFTVGMALVKAIQVSSVCRNANVMEVRSINMADPNNQKLVARTAQGLGMTDSSGNINTSGKGVIVLSRIQRVGAPECAQVNDASGNPLTPGNCPNYGFYVFTNRIVIGNASLFSGTIGAPTSPTNAQGDIAVSEWVTKPGNRATNFPADNYNFTPTPTNQLPNIGNAIL